MTDLTLSRWADLQTSKTSGTRTVTYYLTKPDFAFGTLVHVHVSCRTKSQSGDLTFKVKSAGDGGTIVEFIVALVNGRTDSFECDIPLTALTGIGNNVSAGLEIADILTGSGAAHFAIEVHVK